MGRGQERTSSKDSAVLCNQACAVAPGELENYELYKRMKGWDYSIHKQSMERPEINLMRLSKFVFCRPYITGADPGFQKGGWMADHIY